MKYHFHSGEVRIFVSVSGFTREGERECRHEQRRIRLIDRGKLFDLWGEYYQEIAETERYLLQIDPVWFLAVAGRDTPNL